MPVAPLAGFGGCAFVRNVTPHWTPTGGTPLPLDTPPTTTAGRRVDDVSAEFAPCSGELRCGPRTVQAPRSVRQIYSNCSR